METMIEFIMGFIPATWQGYLPLAVTIATAITMFLKSRSKNPFFNTILVVLNGVAGNLAKNKNADDK